MSFSCENCAWSTLVNTQRRCLALAPTGQTLGSIVQDDHHCDLWETLSSCDPCGACCREAFDAVPVETDNEHQRLDRVWPGFVLTESDGWRHLLRVPSPLGCGTRCAALSEDARSGYSCRVYADRPQTCRGLQIQSAACLHARRRVGLSAWPQDMQPDGPLFRQIETKFDR